MADQEPEPKPPKQKRQNVKMVDVMAMMSSMARQNEELVAVLRAQAQPPQAHVAVPPPAAPATVPPPPPAAGTHQQLSAKFRRAKRDLRNTKTIGALVPEAVVNQFHAVCAAKGIPVYEGMERALSAWIELES